MKPETWKRIREIRDERVNQEGIFEVFASEIHRQAVRHDDLSDRIINLYMYCLKNKKDVESKKQLDSLLEDWYDRQRELESDDDYAS